jgi:hypothetical protein
MRVGALLCWYDERDDWLFDAVVSAAGVGCTAVAALDGRYEQFPAASVSSPATQWLAIREAAAAVKMDVRIAGPSRDEPWPNEMVKRTHLFRMGDELGVDWFFVIDADEVARPTCDLTEDLRLIDEVVAMGRLTTAADHTTRLRNLFRAIPGICVVGRHWIYVTPDGRYLWGPEHLPLEDAAFLPDFEVVHRERGVVARTANKMGYYRVRNTSGVEHESCQLCQRGRATRLVPRGDTTIVICRRCYHLYDYDGEVFA